MATGLNNLYLIIKIIRINCNSSGASTFKIIPMTDTLLKSLLKDLDEEEVRTTPQRANPPGRSAE